MAVETVFSINSQQPPYAETNPVILQMKSRKPFYVAKQGNANVPCYQLQQTKIEKAYTTYSVVDQSEAIQRTGNSLT